MAEYEKWVEVINDRITNQRCNATRDSTKLEKTQSLSTLRSTLKQQFLDNFDQELGNQEFFSVRDQQSLAGYQDIDNPFQKGTMVRKVEGTVMIRNDSSQQVGITCKGEAQVDAEQVRESEVFMP
mmetsp:Transcript_17862/g.30324  ORF Transcript_17862/g.30324 Transcript_17862/m.30324 type:complete len:125 (+) Transcript_17862:648-1022(+)